MNILYECVYFHDLDIYRGRQCIIDDEDDEMSEMKSSNSILTWKYWFQF